MCQQRRLPRTEKSTQQCDRQLVLVLQADKSFSMLPGDAVDFDDQLLGVAVRGVRRPVHTRPRSPTIAAPHENDVAPACRMLRRNNLFVPKVQWHTLWSTLSISLPFHGILTGQDNAIADERGDETHVDKAIVMELGACTVRHVDVQCNTPKIIVRPSSGSFSAQFHHELDVLDQLPQHLHVADALNLGKLNILLLDQPIAAEGQMLAHLPQKLIEERLTV
mmetsp:Transcript_39445/g.119189  ORF Transcript_39445/g.119189 Transcript_39445/m.119189 type:complete len:221 (-) Transcript_39445:280-942(-)